MSVEYLVKSIAPSGAHVTTRHHSPETAAVEIASRKRQHHARIRSCEAAPGETVYATPNPTTATKPLKRKPTEHRRALPPLVEAKRPARLKKAVAL